MTPPNNQKLGQKPDRKLPPLWSALEAYFQRTYRIQPLGDDPTCLFAYNLFTYKGPEVPLKCGGRVRRGDTALELHFRRAALLPLIRTGDSARMGVELLKLGDRDMPRLALALESDPSLAEVRAVHALTLFHRGVTRYGFEVQPVREWYVERWFTWWHRLLMARDHAHGRERVRAHMHKLVTRHIWVSREAMVARYGRGSTGTKGPVGSSSSGG